MLYKNVELWNVAEIFEKEDGIELLRIPEEVRNRLNENAKSRSLMPAGCEIRFNLKSEKAKIVLKGIDGKGICEVFFGDFFESWKLVKEESTEIEIKYPQNIESFIKISKEKNLQFDPKLVRVILPHLLITKIVDIEGDFEIPEENQTPKIKYLAYGSSITHGSSSIRPTGSYAMKTAQLLGVDLINLGFGGGAHLEKEIADYIAERDDWNFGTFELGINMVLWCETEEFKRRVDYFIEKIVSRHSDKYLFFIDIFPFYMDFENQEKQMKFRDIVKNKVKEINKSNVIHISGFEILKSIKGLAIDLVHPSPYGMEDMALNLSSIIKKYFSLH